MYSLNLAADGRILSVTYSEFAPDYQPKISTLPEGDTYDYKYINGQYIYDPLPKVTELTPDSGKQYVTFNDLNKALSKGVNSI